MNSREVETKTKAIYAELRANGKNAFVLVVRDGDRENTMSSSCLVTKGIEPIILLAWCLREDPDLQKRIELAMTMSRLIEQNPKGD